MANLLSMPRFYSPLKRRTLKKNNQPVELILWADLLFTK